MSSSFAPVPPWPQPPRPTQADAALPAITLAAFLWAFVATAIFALTSRYPGYVHHDTSEIAMWSSLGWPLGLPKHPPFLPWLFRAYSTLVPLNWITIDLLTAANITLGAWAVWRIALLSLDDRRAAIAAFLYGLAPAGTFFAVKLNHNAILVSLWPLTILAFLNCLNARTTTRSLATGLIFGAFAAISMLAKYYSGVLLASCLLAALASRDRLRFFTQPGGYIAILMFAALIAPHVWWMATQDHGSLEYALHATEHDARPFVHFLAVAPTYLAPPFIGFVALRMWLGSSGTGTQKLQRAPELMTLAISPFLITAILIAAFQLSGATTWTLPDFSVVPVLLAGLIAIPSDANLVCLKRIAAASLALIAILGPVVLALAFAMGESNATEPRAEAAVTAARMFEANTGKPPRLVTGDPQSANSAYLAIPSHPLVFDFGGAKAAPWSTTDAIDRDGLLIICRPTSGCDGNVYLAKLNREGRVCEVSVQRQWFGMTGRPMTAKITIIPPRGASFTPSEGTPNCQNSSDFRGSRSLAPH